MTSSDFIAIDEPDEDQSATPRVWDAAHYVDGHAVIGEMLVTFDRVTFLNLFSDYPHKFTAEQIEIIRQERPFWYDFFKDRLEETPTV